MIKQVNDTGLYDRCCFESPRIKTSSNINGQMIITYSAQCFSCGNTVESNDPYDLIIQWNKTIRRVI